jgi:D-aminopeptidase
MVSRYPEIGVTADVVIPVVGECDDSWLNDSGGQHVEERHVIQALESAKGGPVEEGAVGGGTGMVCCDFKGGIGTSSRVVEIGSQPFMLGVLAMTNFGVMRDLRVDGLRIGELLEPELGGAPRRRYSQGSIICVLATDVPLVSEQMRRLCLRMALGVGRAGSHAAPASGEIMVGFSTANSVPRQSPGHEVYRLSALLDASAGPLYDATVDVTEEAILNSLTTAEAMEGLDGHFAPALPLDRVEEIFKRHQEILRT